MSVRVLRLAAGGDGVARLADGRTVFVPRTAPGDLVELAQLRESRRFARARIGALLEPGPDRVVPPCPHYLRDDCGGCQLQHVGAEAQRNARRGFVGDALRRLGGIETDDPEIVPADRDWNYRTKLTLHVARGRIGLHPLDRPLEVFDLQTCPITAEPLLELWSEARSLRHLLPPDAERVVLRLDRSSRRHLTVEAPAAARWTGAAELHALLAAAGVPATLWLRAGKADAEPVFGAGDEFPAAVFEQVHPEMGARARAHALAALGPAHGRHAWDLYAGVGDSTAALLEAGATVESVESDRRAVEWAARADDAPGSRSRVLRLAGRVEEVIDRLRSPSLVLTNPPRTGMHERATAAIAARRPERIVYVSCDPATLARDLRRLGAGYRLTGLTAFDLFPQTAHVETVAVLERS
jgi:23S rRNA (uracil1939-C5)-methyltransferase